MENPNKGEIQQIFKRLRSVATNKVCFDCHAKNPTWASITYGIFICIDCSGIHRSLGVHLTFVRSTQLDSNWTWQQIRQMQLGGNANAAMRLHGNKLFIDGPQNAPTTNEDKEGAEGAEALSDADFFETEVNKASSSSNTDFNSETSSVKSQSNIAKNGDLKPGEGPNVEAALTMTPDQVLNKQEPRKSTIGQRKPQGKKLGAKKLGGGLGATKVKKDFAEVEREAEMADQVRTRMDEEKKEMAMKSQEDQAKAVASMRLAYQDLSAQQKKKEDKIRQIDPKKASEFERLGMGVSGKSGVSHSAITEFGSIEQEEPHGGRFGGGRSSSGLTPTYTRQTFAREEVEERDDFGGFGNSWKSSSKSYDDDFGGPSPFRKAASSSNDFEDSNWEKEFEVLKTTSSIGSNSAKSTRNEWNNNERPVLKSMNLGSMSQSNSSYGTDEAQKKFAGAKSISSDMFFDQDANGGPDANVNRFQGSSSISSAEYFGREETRPGGSNYSNMNTPDMDEVKESVKQGVSKVAGRLSNMASGVMNQLQVKIQSLK
ncbi:hypothetical protein TCAL_00895 [Tigriopus californicus]|uniref:Arf-GAP domain-containing protein n=1 Tax=Tigriopus californicus TaxID=6832 RepID=A0A553P6N6_TIGCA|nr:hypothetical protein TCAL_00895 [Tigriopus californicus]